MALLTLAVVALSYTVAKPTFDTTDASLVVSSDPPTEENSDVSTTEEPNAPIELTEMDVLSKISLRYAHTSVVTRVRNPASRAQETTFRMLLPDTAFISGFTMTVDGKSYKAFVKKKEEAKQIYSEAVSRGFGAAHIAAKARDSNHFTVSMNVEPRSTVVFNLTYEELLVRRNGVYNHAINLHPGAIVPKMQVTVHIKETRKISTIRVPEIRTGNEIDANENDPQYESVVINRTEDENEAIITFIPDDAEQIRLIKVYAEKSGSHGDENKGLLGQFVVQYDVDRSVDGEILVNDGYFVHFFAPTSLPPLPKHVVFVLDTSISMSGREIEQLRDAMRTILNTLNSGDHFSIIKFDTDVQVLDWSETGENRVWKTYDKYNRNGIVMEATPENIARAQTFISTLDACGATNIAEALYVAVNIAKGGAANNNTENSVAAEINKLEPIIFFLTDGDPTSGEIDTTVIINGVNEENFGENKASIFSIAFGSDPDRNFLRKLSLSNSGFMRHIYMAADAALQLQDFYRTVASPLLADVQFQYPKEQITEGSVTESKFRAYYAGSEAVVAGRVAAGAPALAPRVLGKCRAQGGPGRQTYEISLSTPVVPKESYFPLERIWAYVTIKQLLDQKDALIQNDENKGKVQDLEKTAMDIALQYEFVTPLTSLVVVKPDDTRAVELKPVDDNDSFDNPGRSYSTPMRFRTGFHHNYRIYPKSLRSRVHKTPPTTTVAPSTTAQSNPSSDPLEPYSLKEFPWALSLLDAASDSLVLHVNGTQVNLKLTKDINTAPAGGAACSPPGMPAGMSASCQYLPRCAVVRNISARMYETLYCVLENGYAGVCCPNRN
ncbi:inter-alpha-trypsin inhibitor heavy chain H4-like [Epargyreus clarus]|uniref:inter-alpha-trypsin inhibitor heavy chain H4-like n=1 Tax=Epargyreus clarus TaxID=520877 RepID=UPI003C2DF09D